jgi:hypothetical protein
LYSTALQANNEVLALDASSCSEKTTELETQFVSLRFMALSWGHLRNVAFCWCFVFGISMFGSIVCGHACFVSPD